MAVRRWGMTVGPWRVALGLYAFRVVPLAPLNKLVAPGAVGTSLPASN